MLARRQLLSTTLLLLLALPGCDLGQPTAPTLEPHFSIQALASGLPFSADAVAANGHYACALLEGRAFCWGSRPKLGDSPVPIAVPGDHRFVSISAGENYACALEEDGTAYCWGNNWMGQLGAGLPTWYDSGPDYAVTTEPIPVSGDLHFRQIAAGLGLTCGITPVGAAYCWGSGDYGQLGNGLFQSSNVPVAVDTDLTFESIGVGFTKACGLSASGLAYCWGDETSGFGNGEPNYEYFTTPILAASGMTWTIFDAGVGYACGVDPEMKAWCWGNYNWEKMGLGLRGSGLIPSPSPVAGGFSFSFIDAHSANTILGSTCALTPAGQAYCWGSNYAGVFGGDLYPSGQLGNTTTEACELYPYSYPCSTTPVPVLGGISFTSIAVAQHHTCGLGSDGIAYCWGDNSHGQLGNGTLEKSMVPVPVSLPTPETVTGYLVDQIEELFSEGTLGKGLANSLLTKLERCLAAADANRLSAANVMRAFINQVESLVSEGILTNEEGEALVVSAKSVITLLEI